MKKSLLLLAFAVVATVGNVRLKQLETLDLGLLIPENLLVSSETILLLFQDLKVLLTLEQ